MAKKKKKAPLISAGSGPLIATVVAALVVVALWMLFTGPSRSGAAAEEENLTLATETLQQNEARLAALRSGKESSAEKLLVKSRELEAALPLKVDRIGVVSRADSLARGVGVTLQEMTPVDSAVVDGHTVNNYQVAATGSMTALSTFVGRLYAWDPLTTISTFNLSSTTEGFTATFSVAIHTASTTPVAVTPAAP